jgi:hypothetical protein
MERQWRIPWKGVHEYFFQRSMM